MDQPHARRNVLNLAALQGADEVPLEQVGVFVLFRGEILRAVLAHERDARLSERGQVFGVDVLDRGADLDRVPDALADALQVSPDAVSVYVRHTSPPWRPVTPPSRRCEKKRSSRQLVQRSTCSMCSMPAVRKLASAIARRSSMRPFAKRASNCSRTSSPTS